jgi:hypothetical protein
LEPQNFTPEELAALIAEAISWLKQQRENFLPSSIPLNSGQKKKLQPFFTAEYLVRLKIESGLWMVVPLAEQANQMDARYTGNPAETFSVEEEVREWLRSGRF